MVSGGADSACAAAGLARVLGAERVHASHVNYGLREGAADGEAAARRLCAALRIDLHVERPGQPARRQPPGRRARRVRYDAAERLRDAHRRRGDRHRPHAHRRRRDGALPARRLARLAGAARAARRATAAWSARCSGSSASGSASWPPPPACRSPTTRPTTTRASPATGSAPRCCRCCARSTPGAEPNIAETRAELAEEAALLERVVLEALAEAGAGAGAVAIPRGGARRLGARRCGASPCGRSPSAPRAARSPLGRARAAEIVRLAARPEGGAVELGGGLRGDLRVAAPSASAPRAVDAAPAPRRSRSAFPASPGSARWEVRAELHPGAGRARRPRPGDARRRARSAARSRSAPGATATASARSGCAGTKTLGTCSPTAACRARCAPRCPVVTVDGEVAWVAGVAVSERLPPRPRRGPGRGAHAPAR